MLRILQERAKVGIEIKVIGSVTVRVRFEVLKLGGTRLHTRTIIRDGRRAFVGSQSLRTLELDSRRELGLITHNAKVVKKLVEMFGVDWASSAPKTAVAPAKEPDVPSDEPTSITRRSRVTVLPSTPG